VRVLLVKGPANALSSRINGDLHPYRMAMPGHMHENAPILCKVMTSLSTPYVSSMFR
jgi:hypothetical protein